MSESKKEGKPKTIQVERRGFDIEPKKKQNFFRALIADDNNISESNLIGLISFALLVIIIAVDIFATKLNVEPVYVTILQNLTIAFFGVGGAVKGFKAFARKTTTFEIPED